MVPAAVLVCRLAVQGSGWRPRETQDLGCREGPRRCPGGRPNFSFHVRLFFVVSSPGICLHSYTLQLQLPAMEDEGRQPPNPVSKAAGAPVGQLLASKASSPQQQRRGAVMSCPPASLPPAPPCSQQQPAAAGARPHRRHDRPSTRGQASGCGARVSGLEMALCGSPAAHKQAHWARECPAPCCRFRHTRELAHLLPASGTTSKWTPPATTCSAPTPPTPARWASCSATLT